ncbi:hypothetical protein GE09DRAFT_651334 [Coniochaeta sp. 2T2.1]|nr:hypothetical protein GE09DRAFT_651334 [Coniochaeta sp. 2T2.1]
MSTMFKKKEVFTVITPIPGFIPRQLAIDILHSHSEVITLNPLVLEHKPISAPRDAQADEFYSTWYEITERIQYIPGMGRMGSGTIKFNGCFHDMPWGLQTHIYAPMNVDLRNKYRIAGNQPGVEAPEQPEIGLKQLGAPADGLYLREDIEIKCNVTIMSFVKGELKKAGKEMVARIIKKAELLDAGVLQGMIENGKLKTLNPSDRTSTIKSPIPSPTQLYHQPGDPKIPSPMTPSSTPYQVPRPQSYMPAYNRPGTAESHAHSYHGGQPQHQPPPHQEYAPHNSQQLAPMELPASEPNVIGPTPIEMPGDYEYYNNNNQPQASPGLAPHQPPTPSSLSQRRDSTRSQASEVSRFNSPDPSQSGRWSAHDFQSSQQSQQSSQSRPTSLASSDGGFRSPGLDHKGFASDLATHNETNEEHRDETLRKLDPSRIPQPSHFQQYNPADYAKEQQAQREQHQKATYPYGNQVQYPNYQR